MDASFTIETLLEDVQYSTLLNSETSKLSTIAVTNLTSDSREVSQDTIFVALEGVGVDGHTFIAGAIAEGAVAVVGTVGRLADYGEQFPEVVFIEVKDSYEAYAAIAANYFSHPAKDLMMAAVTGTNGKTTVTYIVEDILKKAGKSVGVIGTVNNRYTLTGGETTFLPTLFTTPEAYSLQAVLREMVDSGVEIVIMEVSSHALAQARVGTLSFHAAAFTNLSRDHLDYHQSMDDYFSAKLALFTHHMQSGATAVLPQSSTQDSMGERIEALHQVCSKGGIPVISWGREEGADVQLINNSSQLENSELEVQCCHEHFSLKSLLVGDYNMDNLLTSMGLCSALGVSLDSIKEGVSKTTGAPGRLERITADGWDDNGPTVFVDYAHTPDALEKVLQTAKKLPHHTLYGVFGCGGDRDPGKRAVMGKIGGTLCDVSIVTDDNPRTEDPDHIVSQILEGVEETGQQLKDKSWLQARKRDESGCVVVRDRAKAIEAAIRAGKKGDIIIIAGKGHEPYQLTLQGKKYFDDRQQARDVLWSWTLPLLGRATGGKIFGDPGDTGLLGQVFTDSRLKTNKGIFVALVGENHDAHDYAAQAVENGAGCLIVDREIEGLGLQIPQVVVTDTLEALGEIAAYRRGCLKNEFPLTLIGLTGSCGKTTVKEMIAAILKRKFPAGEHHPEDAVLKTEGNFNNLIGLPLSLLPLGVHQRAAVIEMGMNVPGEIKRLAEIADPDICLITNIHGAHLQGLQSIEGVGDAKEELFQASRRESSFIVNLDDERVARRAEKYSQSQITYGLNAVATENKPDVFATDIKVLDGGAVTFTLHYQGREQDIHLYIAGVHNVSNALAAAASTFAAGCTMEEVALGLADFRAPDKRMELFSSSSGFQILNDTYNANPASMEAGLRTLAAISKGKKIAVIGDMLELGDDAVKAHYNTGKVAATLGLDLVLVYGEWSQDVARGMVENGSNKNDVIVAETKEEIQNYIEKQTDRGSLGEEDLVLFKASRGLRFETIVECFR